MGQLLTAPSALATQVVVSGDANFQQHLASKKHARRLAQLAARSVHSVAQPGTGRQGEQQQAAREYVGPAAADVAPYVDQVGGCWGPSVRERGRQPV